MHHSDVTLIQEVSYKGPAGLKSWKCNFNLVSDAGFSDLETVPSPTKNTTIPFVKGQFTQEMSTLYVTSLVTNSLAVTRLRSVVVITFASHARTETTFFCLVHL